MAALYGTATEHAQPSRTLPLVRHRVRRNGRESPMRAPDLHRRTRAPHPSSDTRPALLLALTAVRAARVQLDRVASATDAPAWQVVEAADLLDAAHNKLADAAKVAP